MSIDRSGPLKETGVLVPVIYWGQFSGYKQYGKQDRSREEAEQRCVFSWSLASAWSHGEPWNMNEPPALLCLEARGLDVCIQYQLAIVCQLTWGEGTDVNSQAFPSKMVSINLGLPWEGRSYELSGPRCRAAKEQCSGQIMEIWLDHQQHTHEETNSGEQATCPELPR